MIGAFFLFAIALSTQYEALDQNSLREQLSFFWLFPDSPEGVSAKERSHALLKSDTLLPVLSQSVEAQVLTEEEILAIDTLSTQFPNRQLKGYSAQSLQELQALPPSDIDISRSLLLCEGADEQKQRQYLAHVDLIALECKAALGDKKDPNDIVDAISKQIFYTLRFRFPPASRYEAAIDDFSYLGTVLDKRRGVCLGVSLLYMSIAQRLGLELEAVTPPGHIYIRTKTRNIETTARGIHLKDEAYLGLNCVSLKTCDSRGVLGLLFQNAASVKMGQKKWNEAAELYEKALRFLPHDSILEMLLGTSLLLCNKKADAGTHLLRSCEITQNELISAPDFAKSLIAGQASAETVALCFTHLSERHSDIVHHLDIVEKRLEKEPFFTEGLFYAAQLNLRVARPLRAIALLERVVAARPDHMLARFELAALLAERAHFFAATTHLNHALLLAHNAGRKAEVLHNLALFLASRNRNFIYN